MSEERLLLLPPSEFEEAATIKDRLMVRREGTRHLGQVSSHAPRREKGGKA